jgi:steroid 5-alpha reductase family enzyme
MGLKELFHSVATGSRRRRQILTPLGLTFFGLTLLGIGFMLNSISIVAIWTPLYIIAHVIELKKVEEPELEQRFGASYVDYRREVPMFIPRPWRYRRRPAV